MSRSLCMALAFVWMVLLWGGWGYAVFVLHASGWWVILALVLSADWRKCGCEEIEA